MLERWIQGLAANLFPYERTPTRGELLFFRFFEFLIGGWALQAGWTWAETMLRHRVVVLPLGLANYFDLTVFFAPVPAYGLVAALTLFVVLGFTRVWRFGYAGALVALHLLYASRYSLGEISHGSNFVGLALVALALGAWRFRTSASMYRFVFGLLFFLYGVGYASAGVCKLVASGLSWPMGEHMALWVGERSVDVTSSFGAFEPNFLQRLVLSKPWVGTLALTFGLLAELAGVAIWYEKPRPYVMTALIGMHLGVELCLSIYFGQNIYILTLLAYPWGRWLDRALTYLGGRPLSSQVC